MKIKKHITLDKEIIEKAEKKAKKNGVSLSAYISTLIAKDNEKKSNGLFESISEM